MEDIRYETCPECGESMTENTYEVDGIGVMCESCFKDWWLGDLSTKEIAERMTDVIVRYNG